MPDLREVLDRAAPGVSDVDVEAIRGHARRRRVVPRAAIAAAAAVAIAGLTLVIVTRDEGNGHRVVSTPSPTSTNVAPTTTTTSPTTTSAPEPTITAPAPPTVPLGEDRLSTESRLGYAGL